jgi:ribosomal protein S18 acetylase RimI-like enzyme
MEIVRASILDLGELRRFDGVCFPNDTWNLFERLVVLVSPGTVRLKVLEEGRIVAFAAARNAGPDGVAWIRSIGVLPDFRHRGLARELLRACEAELGAPRMHLFVRASNAAAIRLYETEGYAMIDLHAGFYRDGEAAAIMAKANEGEAAGPAAR